MCCDTGEIIGISIGAVFGVVLLIILFNFLCEFGGACCEFEVCCEVCGCECCECMCEQFAVCGSCSWCELACGDCCAVGACNEECAFLCCPCCVASRIETGKKEEYEKNRESRRESRRLKRQQRFHPNSVVPVAENLTKPDAAVVEIRGSTQHYQPQDTSGGRQAQLVHVGGRGAGALSTVQDTKAHENSTAQEMHVVHVNHQQQHQQQQGGIQMVNCGTGQVQQVQQQQQQQKNTTSAAGGGGGGNFAPVANNIETM